MNRHIEEVEFTIFDTETTGLEPQAGDRVVELAAIRFKGEERLATFSTLVNPEREISAGAFAVNKISKAMLEDAPKIAKVMPEFLEFIKGSCLCSYNACFDLEFMRNESRLLNSEFPQEIIVLDILKMARKLLPKLERYALWFVVQHLGIKQQQQHRALSDVEITWMVFRHLKEKLVSQGVYDFGNFSRLFSVNPQLLENINTQRISEIEEAISREMKLKIKYLSSINAQVTERQVIPKEIKQERGTSYLVGFCSLRNEERSFRIDGILHLEIV
ncbi:MAG: exonuclease domain-containing protein [Candidatus Omnitrophica bacterium]|nr:exonuclease domain-containing protein [Candidatus Omnitrophota bacterium]